MTTKHTDNAERLYHLAGGEFGIRLVIRTFYDRVFDDAMIGFFFKGVDKARLIDKEFEFTAALLGAPQVKYTGKPIRQAHAKHPIMGGHFERRLQLLREALEFHNVPDEVRAAWIGHTESLRHLVTRDAGTECIHVNVEVEDETP